MEQLGAAVRVDAAVPHLEALQEIADRGDGYLDTVYRTNWVEDLYGPDAIDPDRTDELTGTCR